MLASLVPTVLMTALGIILVAHGQSWTLTAVTGILVLAFCGTALTGYLFGTYFVMRGANVAKLQNEFLSSVSHEVRTPLTSILMFIDTLQEERVTAEERKRCLAVIRKELTRLDGLVGSLIQLSKIDSQRAVLERSAVRIDDVVDDALGAFEAMKLGQQVHVRTTLGTDLRILGNRAALAQAVGNLLSNALKFTPAMAAEKRIDLRTEGGPNTVSISVSDNGLGVERDERKTIFETFERGSAAAAGGSPGSGLGLAIVRAVVDAHHGKVEVDSEPGRGTTFRIVLPRYRLAA